MEKRDFGKTGLKTSILGFGGFHLLEISLDETKYLLNSYLDSGGNYIETAESYGDGQSELKIGLSVSKRRKEYILASKTLSRDRKKYLKSIEGSLKRLKTDYLDLHIIHALGLVSASAGIGPDDFEKILAPGGALEAAEKARKEGKIRFIGVSMHGQPDTLIEAIENYPFDAVMATINYYDRFNFPEIENLLMPLALKKNIAIILMKPLADGYLYRSKKQAFNYAFSQEVSVVVTGINSREMLKEDIGFVNDFKFMSEDEKSKLFIESIELGDYVCRQCMKCLPCQKNIPIPEIFKLEGYFDRQMSDGIVRNPADYALRERLRFWYGGENKAKGLYKNLKINVSNCNECGDCNPRCPYGIDIIKKLKIADFKLSGKTLY